jgi:hypothetical protein
LERGAATFTKSFRVEKIEIEAERFVRILKSVSKGYRVFVSSDVTFDDKMSFEYLPLSDIPLDVRFRDVELLIHVKHPPSVVISELVIRGDPPAPFEEDEFLIKWRDRILSGAGVD